MAADKCQSCKREIANGWMLCRPCALGKTRGVEPYSAPCDQFVPDPVYPKLIPTCDRCGFEHPRL